MAVSAEGENNSGNGDETDQERRVIVFKRVTRERFYVKKKSIKIGSFHDHEKSLFSQLIFIKQLQCTKV